MRFPSFYLAAASLAFAPALRAEPQQPTPAPQQQSNRLESGRTIERTIIGRRVDTFHIAMDSGEMVHVAMTPRGINLDVDIYGPGGKYLGWGDHTPDGPEMEAKVVAQRAGDHRIEISAVDTTAAPGRYSLTVEVLSRDQLAALAAADRSRRAATVEWLAANAVRLRTVDAGHGFDDMEPLRAIVGDAHVVALGEATHGAHEFFALKHRMLEFLVTKMGFTVFAMEAMMSEGFDVNDYVRTGRGDPGKALSALYYWDWNTEEILDLIEWMRRWNADPRHTRKVKFYGFDMGGPTRLVTAVRDYLRRVDPSEANVWGTAFPYQSTLLRVPVPPMSASPTATQDSLLRAARAELARLDERRDAYVRRSSAEEWDVARAHIRNLLPYLEPPPPGSSRREKLMAENIDWILQHEGPGTKAVVWAHNQHVRSDCDKHHAAMGCFVRRSFGHDLVVFGFAFNRGSFHALPWPATIEDRQRPFEVRPAADSSLDGTLAQAGFSIAAVDLRNIPAGPVADWFDQPRLTLSTGVGYSEHWVREVTARPMTVRRSYDALLFVDSTSPSHLRPDGIWPARVVLPAPINLDFEDRGPNGGPRGWYPAPSFDDFGFVDPEYRLSSTAENPYHGKRSAVVARSPSRHYGLTNGGLEQIVDATPYRGKWIRVTAMCREQALGADSHASLWLSLTPKFVADMQVQLSGERTITGKVWRPYEIVLQVPETTVTISYGLSLAGDGRAWIDDVSLELVPKPPE